MPLPLSTITFLRTRFTPFSPLSRPCRLLLTLLQTPKTLSASSPTHIKTEVKHLPRDSKEAAEIVVGFKTGEEVRFEWPVDGKGKMRVRDVVEEVCRVGRRIEREESLKGN